MSPLRRRILGFCAVLFLGAAGAYYYMAGTEALGSWDAEPQSSALRIGVVWDSDSDNGHFVKGARLARDQINDQGGVLGRPLQLVEVHEAADSPDRQDNIETARKLSQLEDLIAVIGYQVDKSAVAATITYMQNDVIMINAGVTDYAVNKRRFFNVFSTIPDNSAIGVQVATFADGLGYKNIAILSSREDWAFQTADAFAAQAATLGIRIAARRSFSQRNSFRDLLAAFGLNEFDAMLLLASGDRLATIIDEAREMKLETDLIIGGFVDLPQLQEAVGQSEHQIVTPIFFNPESKNWTARRFVVAFDRAYGEQPSGWAAQGYDAVRMLAEVVEANGVAAPQATATTLRYSLTWLGVTGRHSFDRTGRAYSKQLGFAILRDGQITYTGNGQ